jgi:hypothetical protein
MSDLQFGSFIDLARIGNKTIRTSGVYLIDFE